MKHDSIFIEQENCLYCLKCLKNCPVKAIDYLDGHISIQNGRCIACGICYDTCPSGSVAFRNDVQEVRQIIKNNQVIVASLSPTWVAEFPKISAFSFIEALKLLGFTHVSETTLGTNKIADETAEYLKRTEKLCICSFCPAVNKYIRQYHPQLSETLLPFVSPVEAHARMIQQWYGENAKIVSISNCIAEKEIVEETNGLISASLTFNELKLWMQQEGIDPEFMQNVPSYHFEPFAARKDTLYVSDESIFDERLSELQSEKGLQVFRYSGRDEITEIIRSLENKPFRNFPIFLELYACNGGCLQGSGTIEKKDPIGKRMTLRKYDIESRKYPIYELPYIQTARTFLPSETTSLSTLKNTEEYRKIFETLLMNPDEKLMNCGDCGYDTCNDFIRAVVEKRAHGNMCTWYQQKVAQNKFSSLIRHLTSGVFIVDADMKIMEANRNFAVLMGPEVEMAYDANPGMAGTDVSLIVPFHKYIESALKKEDNESFERDVQIKGRMLKLTLFPLQPRKIVCGLMRNLFQMDVRNDEIINRTRKVINDNMETVQQIAYLLGSNASRTEAILNSIIESQTIDDGQQ